MMQPHLTMQYVVVLGFLITAVMGVSAADDANEDAIKKDRKRIEGTWTIVSLVINGNSSTVDAGKMIVVNGADGSWNLTVDGQEIVQGTTTIDPSKKPRRSTLRRIQVMTKGRFTREFTKWETTFGNCVSPPLVSHDLRNSLPQLGVTTFW